MKYIHGSGALVYIMALTIVWSCLRCMRLIDQCIDIELEHRIRVRSRGDGALARFVTGSTPAKVPYLLGFYPPTLWSPGDYPNINFLKEGSNRIVILTHRDRPGTPASLSDYPQITQASGSNGTSIHLFPFEIRDRLGPNPSSITLKYPPHHLSHGGNFPLQHFDPQNFLAVFGQFPQEQYNG